MNIRDINRGFTVIKSKMRNAELDAIRKHNLDVSELQWNYLVWVIENKDMKMSDLAATLGVQKGTLSNNIKYLVEKGLITKKENGRSIIIEPTAKGKKYHKLHIQTHKKIKEELLNIITEDEFNELIRIGVKLIDEF